MHDLGGGGRTADGTLEGPRHAAGGTRILNNGFLGKGAGGGKIRKQESVIRSRESAFATWRILEPLGFADS